ncbi:MAG: aerotolerance regulator BatA [Gemmatimonadetes bacterium]|nr:MAG: aerotolerance regulator BatA [Gemmatimonadota bacterium]
MASSAAAGAPPGASGAAGPGNSGHALARGGRAQSGGGTGRAPAASRHRPGGSRGAPGAERGRVPCGGGAHAAPRAATGARGSAGAARPGRVLRGPRDGRGRARRHGAPPDAGDRPVSFARPLFLGLLALLPLWWWLRARRLARLSGTRMSDVRPAEGVTERLWVARLPVTLRSVCLGAWMVAAAGPRLGSARKETRSEGISIVLCVDLSSSMLAEDFAPANRIDVAKQTALEFVRARTSDRIGVVAFAAQALTQVPITTDYAVLEEALRELRVGMLEDGTAIGTAIATAATRLRRAPGKSKVIILLTDGVNNRGTVDPRTAAQAAAAFGIRIYTIGVGTRGEAPVPTGQGVDGLRYQNLPVEIDEPLLTDVARATGGRYFRATDSESLRHVFEEINRLEKTTVEQVVYRRFDEAYRVPLALGLLALGLEVVISATFAVRVP